MATVDHPRPGPTRICVAHLERGRGGAFKPRTCQMWCGRQEEQEVTCLPQGTALVAEIAHLGRENGKAIIPPGKVRTGTILNCLSGGIR